MKNKNFLNVKIKIVACLMVFMFSFSTAKAQWAVIDPANLVQSVTQVVQGVTEAYQTVKTVYQATKAATAMAQNLQNFDISQLASSLSSDAMTQVGDIITQNLGTLKDPSTNVLTNGQQVINDLNGYINKSSTNAIKKTLDDLQGANTNPYQSTALSDTIKKIRGDVQSNVDKLKVVGLAAVAQKEICNNSKLKGVIKNGEPATWVNPKKALKNVNIDELCNADLTAKASTDNSDAYNVANWKTPVNNNSSSDEIKNLKAFLFEKNYFVTAPSTSIFDSITRDAVKAFQKDQGLDQSGEVDDLTQTAMLAAERQSKGISGKAAQAALISIANAGYGGALTRAALANTANSPSGIQASVQAEINKQIADSQFAATNKYNANGGVIGNEKCLDKEGNVKKFDPTDPTTAYCDNITTSASNSAAKIKADLDASRQSPYLGILAKTNSTSDCGGKNKTLTDICKGTNKVNGYLSLVNSILGIASNVSGGGETNIKDSQYAQLASSLDGLQKIDESKGTLSSAATASTNNYTTSQGQSLDMQNNALTDTTAADQAQAAIKASLKNAKGVSTTTPINYFDLTGQQGNSNTNPYAGKQFDYDNNSDDRSILNNLMSVSKVKNIVTGNTQILNLVLNTNVMEDWGIDPDQIRGTYRITNKNTGQLISVGDIANTPIANYNIVISSGKKLKIFDSYVLDTFKDEISKNGGIQNTIIDINFNIYFKTLDPQKNPSDFTLDIGFYLDGSKF